MIGDIRFAVRALARDRRFALVVILTLALGIAVNTTVFTLLNSLVLRPLTAPAAERVVRIHPIDDRGERQNLFSYRDYLDYRGQTRALEMVAAYVPVAVTIAVSSDPADRRPDDAVAYAVSASYFALLGMQPAQGRTFAHDEEDAPSTRVGVISDRLWNRRFARDRAALGSMILVNGRPFTIVGVADERFIGSEPVIPEVWLPLSAHDVVAPEADVAENRDSRWLLVIGRLSRGVSRSAAAAELSVVARRLAATYPSPRRPAAVDVVRATFFSLEPRVWPIVLLILGVAALVLVIACANVANLTLARAASRQRELAIRLAIGATRARLVRLLVVESLAIGVAGAAAGLLLSGWLLRFLYPIGVSLVPFPSATVLLDLSPDVRVFAYTFALATAAGTAVGLAPALQFSTRRISARLHEDGAAIGTIARPSAVRHALVVLQVATCLVLLAGAGLLTRAVQRARTLDLGFDPSGVVMTSSDVRRHGYTDTRAAEFNRRLEARASTLAGWRAAAFTSHVPLTGGLRLTSIDAESPPGTRSVRASAPVRFVSARYFDVLRIPIVAGRTFTDEELTGDLPVTIVSEELARRFWPDGQVLGRTVRTSVRQTPASVVGVVRDTSASTVWQGKEMAIYYPAHPSTDARSLHLVVRVEEDARRAGAALDREARQLEPALGFTATPLADVVRLWMLPSRVAAIGASVLAALALVLASIGLYGVIAYNVAQRTREIGVRMALGAAASDVSRLVLREGSRLIAAGVTLGLGGALVTTRVLRGLLLDVSVLEPLTLAAVTLMLCAVGLVACYIPARRAAMLDPWTALR
jgi:predicted permease